MGGHFELARGTALQNRDYIFKEGKWENDKKHGTKIEGTQFEYGELPLEHQGKRTDLADLYDMIKEGMSDLDIIETNPYYITHLDKMDNENAERIVLHSRRWHSVDLYPHSHNGQHSGYKPFLQRTLHGQGYPCRSQECS